VPDGEKEKQTVDISALPLDIIRKVRLIGGIEPLKELRETLLRLRSHSGPALRTTGPETVTLCTVVSIEVCRSIEVAREFSMFVKSQLEVAEAGEQLLRLCRRVALSRFYDFYALAQENPSLFLRDRKTRREKSGPSSDGITREQAPRRSTQVKEFIIDLLFPHTVSTAETAVITGEK